MCLAYNMTYTDERKIFEEHRVEFEGGIFYKLFDRKLFYLKSSSPKIYTLYKRVKMELGKVYIDEDGTIEKISRQSTDEGCVYSKYPKGFHAFLGLPRTDNRPFKTYYPVMLGEIVALDLHRSHTAGIKTSFEPSGHTEIAGRIMYIFDEATWKQYQADITTKPIDLEEMNVNTEFALDEKYLIYQPVIN